MHPLSIVKFGEDHVNKILEHFKNIDLSDTKPKTIPTKKKTLITFRQQNHARTENPKKRKFASITNRAGSEIQGTIIPPTNNMNEQNTAPAQPFAYYKYPKK